MLSFTFLGKFNAENMYGLASQFWAYKSFWRVRLDKVWWSKLNIFFAAKMQLKCNRCPEASIDRPLTEVSTYMCS